MPAYTTLADLRNQLYAETSDSTDAAVTAEDDPARNAILARVQRNLYSQYDWPHLILDKVIPTVVNQIEYEYPADIQFTQFNKMWVEDSGTWREVIYGIGPVEYTVADWTDAARWPVIRWKHRPDLYAAGPPPEHYFEVWPKPSRIGNLHIRGQMTLPDLLIDADTCLLDLIVLHAAGEILDSRELHSGKPKRDAAALLLTRLMAQQGGDKQTPFVMGGGLPSRRLRPFIDYIP